MEDRNKVYDARVDLCWLTCMKLAQTPKYQPMIFAEEADFEALVELSLIATAMD